MTESKTMSRELKVVSVGVLLMFIALMISGTYISVFQAEKLKADGRNVRTLYDSFSVERGAILVEGTPIASSVPVNDDFKFQRLYTQPELYAPVTGYFSLNQGNSGVEGALNQELSGSADNQTLTRLNAIFTGQKPKGSAVELTLSASVQQAAWDALGDRTGAVVAINPKTGAILAMVSKPTFDPNVFADHNTTAVIDAYNAMLADPAQPLFNRTITGNLYHPGSVFKLIVAAAALDSGAATPETDFDNPASLVLPGTNTTIRNANRGPCGGGERVTLADALRLSCNIPFAEIGQSLGEGTVADYAHRFGYDQKLSIPTNVTSSTFPTGLDEAQLMMSSFGQWDVRTTPLQVAMTTAAIANGGVMMKPTLVDRMIAPDLTVEKPFTPTELGSPITPETASTMVGLMVNNVSSGAASSARISGVDVGGKSGTAEGGVGASKTMWFTGFAPANDPQVAVAVVVENESGYGNLVAGPIAKKVIEAVLNK